uniref:Uncharacterized protein n=1 Tax=Mola mola TaxID=94237 RepID=A0A3Q3WHP6_MOLML
VHGHQQGRDREELFVADAVAAGLLGVAREASLLISPNALSCHHEHQNALDEDDGQPNASDSSRVPVYTADQGVKGSPVHLRLQVCKRLRLHIQSRLNNNSL